MPVLTPNFDKKKYQKKFIKNKYRWYSVVVVFAILPLLAADTFNFPQNVFSAGADYLAYNVVAKKVKPIEYNEEYAVNNLSIKITPEKQANMVLNSKAPQDILNAEVKQITTTDVNDPASAVPNSKPTLEDIIPKPASPQFTSEIVYSRVKIKAPISWSTMDDLYNKDAEGNPTIPIEEKKEDIEKGNYESTPIQRLLKNGTVHLAESVDPGEIGNSYIIGHSSNYRQVISNYNYVFSTLTQSKEGDEFIIFDKEGRELRFKVFETIVIDAEDVKTAYKDYGDKRIVTLQASVLVDGKPLKRRLIRGELQIP